MKNIYISLILIGGSISAAFTSCKKDSSASTSTFVYFGLKSDNAATTLATTNNTGLKTFGPTTSGLNITWTSGTANINSFKLEAKRNGTETEITAKNLANVDLFALTPALSSAAIDAGNYTQIEIRMALAKSAGTNLPLVLKGSVASGSGLNIPIELDFNDDALIKAEAENVSVDGKTDLRTLITMHLDKLFTNISASEINSAVKTSNTIVISGSVNSSLYNKIKANLALAGKSNGFEIRSKNR